jgi:hypothetical protein
MNRKLLRGAHLCALGLVLCAGVAFHARAAGENVRQGVWRSLDQIAPEDVAAEPWIRPMRYHAFTLDHAAARVLLNQAPLERTAAAENPLKVEVPLPDGTYATFNFVESPIMEPALQAENPELRTYLGTLDGDTAIWGRFDLTPVGFHGMIFTPEGTIFIDPYSKGNNTLHTSYFREDLPRTKEWACWFDNNLDAMVPQELRGSNIAPGNNPGGNEASGTQLRTYRLALACTGEYATFHGGTVSGASAAMTTTVNRVTGVYEKDLAIRMTLVANNFTQLVYTNATTDPYTNNNGSSMLSQNVSTCSTRIGNANFDIGHVVSTGGGGVAYLGVVCGSNKAGGVTGSPSPVGDAFDIDYVAHEMGHQFGGNHTFNSSTSSCGGGNRNASTAMEQGSGSTIMAYAGICGSDNIQSNSDAYFYSISLDEIIAYSQTSTGNNCPVKTSTGNNIPTIDAGPSYSVPKGTQFALTPASYSDADPADVPNLTFAWEERDLGASTTITTADNGSSPIFRPNVPKLSPTQVFPTITNYSTNVYRTGDRPTNTTRTMNFRCVVRDNRAGGGAVNWDDTQVNVVGTAGPFVCNTPTGSPYAGGATLTLTWNVASTNLAPISCANVKISMSADNGATFPYVLIASTANDGTESITLPNITVASGQGRFKVEAVGNIFFDISNTAFAMNSSTPPSAPTGVTATPGIICPGGSVTLAGTVGLGQTIDWYSGSCGGTLLGSGTSIVINPPSSQTYYARARIIASGLVSTTCSTASVTVDSTPTAPSSASVDRQGFCAGDAGTISLTAVGGSGSTLNWYTGSCGGTLVGSGNPLVIASPGATTTYYARWSTSCGNSSCASVDVAVSTADVSGPEGTPDGVSDLQDFFDFLTWFDTSDPRADIDGNPGVDLGDFFLFLNDFDQGC